MTVRECHARGVYLLKTYPQLRSFSPLDNHSFRLKTCPRATKMPFKPFTRLRQTRKGRNSATDSLNSCKSSNLTVHPERTNAPTSRNNSGKELAQTDSGVASDATVPRSGESTSALEKSFSTSSTMIDPDCTKEKRCVFCRIR